MTNICILDRKYKRINKIFTVLHIVVEYYLFYIFLFLYFPLSLTKWRWMVPEYKAGEHGNYSKIDLLLCCYFLYKRYS